MFDSKFLESIFNQMPGPERKRYLEVIQRVEAIQESSHIVLDLLKRNREAARPEDRARCLIALNAFLDETRETYQRLEDFLGFAPVPDLEDWPTVAQWLRIPQSEEELMGLTEFVAGKRDLLRDLPLTRTIVDLSQDCYQL
ncbi:MAG: hypothetical protein KKG92_07325 [Gammaproteobacteria bacterium]|nr:hypothetical protein [Gammaproteobacteria bacterium]